MKPNKQAYIDFILNELQRGNVQYKEVMLGFVSNFQLTEKTFVVYWKNANLHHKINQDLIKKELASISINAEKERLKKAILSKDEILEKLTEIANKAFSNSKDGTKIDYNNRINAMKVLVDILGLKAPTNTNVSISTVKPLEVVRIEPIQRE